MNKLITNAEAKAQGIEDKVITQEEFDMWRNDAIHSKPIKPSYFGEEIDEEEDYEDGI